MYADQTYSRGGLRKNELQNRKTAIGAFFCMKKKGMETGPIIVNEEILPLKNGFENCHFWVKKPVIFKFE